MGRIKRYPDITKAEHKKLYERTSKASILEAFRDLYRETSGLEFDDTEWMDDLQRRVEILEIHRRQWAAEKKSEDTDATN